MTLTGGDSVEMTCDHPMVPTDESNLMVRAVRAFHKAAGISQGIKMSLCKRIPVGGGLGGGSANAATVLLGLQKMHRTPFSHKKLLQIAGTLGSDVPFFVMEKPWAFGTGRGEQIESLSLPLSISLWHLVIWPSFPIPTKEIYQALRQAGLPIARLPDGQGQAGLTVKKPDVRLLCTALKGTDLLKVSDLLFNALEPTVEVLYPAIRHVKAMIQTQKGLLRPFVSGSGSSVVALSFSREDAEQAAAQIRRQEPGWLVFVAQTQN